MESFRSLHGPGRILVLPNAWDAGSARVIQECGARAIATTSAGLAWSHGYADKGHLPPNVLERAVAEIRRVISVPLTVDIENGYSSDAKQVAETVAAIVQAGAVGINLEDGDESPEVFCAKVEAVKAAAQRAGVDLFVNARTDVYLRRLVPQERALEETLVRGRRYRSAGVDGFFVPLLADTDALRTIAQEIPLPLNALAVPKLAPVAELQKIGVRRVSAGSAIAGMAYAKARAAALQMLDEGRYDAMMDWGDDAPDLNALLAPSESE
jgi:2-methylisocitrate lyase-like PEP mutase family enzyme